MNTPAMHHDMVAVGNDYQTIREYRCLRCGHKWFWRMPKPLFARLRMERLIHDVLTGPCFPAARLTDPPQNCA